MVIPDVLFLIRDGLMGSSRLGACVKGSPIFWARNPMTHGFLQG